MCCTWVFSAWYRKIGTIVKSRPRIMVCRKCFQIWWNEYRYEYLYTLRVSSQVVNERFSAKEKKTWKVTGKFALTAGNKAPDVSTWRLRNSIFPFFSSSLSLNLFRCYFSTKEETSLEGVAPGRKMTEKYIARCVASVRIRVVLCRSVDLPLRKIKHLRENKFQVEKK